MVKFVVGILELDTRTARIAVALAFRRDYESKYVFSENRSLVCVFGCGNLNISAFLESAATVVQGYSLADLVCAARATYTRARTASICFWNLSHFWKTSGIIEKVHVLLAKSRGHPERARIGEKTQ